MKPRRDVPRRESRGRLLRQGVVLAFSAVLLAACGGSGGGGGSSSSSSTGTGTGTTTTPPPVANMMTVTVDSGPAALAAANEFSVNQLYATITVCSPGSTTACKTIDHVQVDTGSTGLRLLASAMTGITPTAATDPTTSRPLLECVQFADGYSWGSVGSVDVTLGTRTLSSLAVHVVGDPAAGTAPSTCASGPDEETVASYGANGILGVGNFLQDCGAACAAKAIAATYYVCPNSSGGNSCTPVAVALTRQIQNPASQLSTDNNGVVIKMPVVSSPGAPTLSGTLYFGVGTQTDNALGTATVYKLTSTGTFTATFASGSAAGSFIDSGSNGYFFTLANVATCADASYFYCPVSSGAPTSQPVSITINGTNGLSSTVSFSIDNADQLFQTNDTALPGLAGPNGSLVNGNPNAVDFGLPFFFGRSVSVIIEGNVVNGVTAPAVAF